MSSSEFHPFTIASSPSDTFMEFYVKGLGNWTNELCNLAKSQQPAVPADAQRERSATAARVQFQHIGAVCGLEVCVCARVLAWWGFGSQAHRVWYATGP